MTTFQKYAMLLISVCFLLLALYVDGAIFWHRGWTAGWSDAMASIQTDTTQHHDTSTYVNPQPVSEEPVAAIPAGYVQVKVGTIAGLKARIAELEAAALNQTPDSTAAPVEDLPVDVALQEERKVYQDSTYRAVVAGINPRLEEIQTFNTTTTITKVVHDLKTPELIASPAIQANFLPGALSLSAMMTFDSWHGAWQLTGGVGYGITWMNGGSQRGWLAELGWKYNLIVK